MEGKSLLPSRANSRVEPSTARVYIPAPPCRRLPLSPTGPLWASPEVHTQQVDTHASQSSSPSRPLSLNRVHRPARPGQAALRTGLPGHEPRGAPLLLPLARSAHAPEVLVCSRGLSRRLERGEGGHAQATRVVHGEREGETPAPEPRPPCHCLSVTASLSLPPCHCLPVTASLSTLSPE